MQTPDENLSKIERNAETNAIEVPTTRLSSASQAKSIYDRMVTADISRSAKRARVRGLVDGNPPYRQSQLKAEGRDYQCNVNWRTAESYFNNASGAFYDIFSEAPSYATVRLKLPDDNQGEYKSRCATEHFDWLLRGEGCFDYHMQVSQNEMVLFGRGPIVFQDEFDWRPTSILDGALRVPDRTKSDTELWELATVEVEYQCHELYEKIIDEKSATAAGWNVAAVKQAIIRSFPKTNDQYRTWEWCQQNLKMDSLGTSYQANTIQVVHFFYREFKRKEDSESKISHKIILANEEGGETTGDPPKVEFLFEKERRYDSWHQCVHPMYYDHGGGGFHHSVTGMGVKMYAPIEYQNRLLCNLADKAFTPKVMLKSPSEGGDDAVMLQQFGDYAVIKPGVEVVQTPISGVMEEGTVFNREITGIISSNLSAYRMNLQREQGNPITAREVDQRASEQARLGKTQLSRYYQQLDHLYAEMYRRSTQKLVKGTPGYDRAKEFQDRCEKNGVTLEELRKVEHVRATRIAGQGSEILRQQALGELFTGVLPMLPETGRDNLITDVIASRVGQSHARRYYPQAELRDRPTDQLAIAMGQVADMKIGVAAVVTDTQNPVIFAQAFLKAAAEASATLEQGANPSEVAQFIELAGQATAQHLERLKQDPSRKAVYEALNEQFMQLAKIHDQLVKQLEAQSEQESQALMERMEAQKRAQAIQNGQDPATMIKAAETAAKIRMQQEKTDAALTLKVQKQEQDMALKDARTAHEIKTSNRKNTPE